MESSKSVADPEEPLVRYLFQGHYRKDLTVKWQAFKPAREDNKTSVYLTRGLDDKAVWSLGADVAAERNQPLHGRADFKNEAVQRERLFVELDSPPDRHANIAGWPSPEDTEQVMLMAQGIADAARMLPVA